MQDGIKTALLAALKSLVPASDSLSPRLLGQAAVGSQQACLHDIGTGGRSCRAVIYMLIKATLIPVQPGLAAQLPHPTPAGSRHSHACFHHPGNQSQHVSYSVDGMPCLLRGVKSSALRFRNDTSGTHLREEVIHVNSLHKSGCVSMLRQK